MARFYTVKETAQILGFSPNTIYKYLDSGRLKGTRGSAEQGRFRIPQSQLDSFLGQPLNANENFTPPVSPSPPTVSVINGVLPLLPIKITRILLIISLIFIVSEVLLSRDFSLQRTSFRLVIIGIFIILSYQFINFSKNKKSQ